MARLEIGLLGPFRAVLNGENITGFDSDKVRALLAYLVVDGDQPHRREKLAGLLWPDYPESSARTSLRRALTNLRQVIDDKNAKPAYLNITRQSIRFNQKSDFYSDVRAFTNLIKGEKGYAPDNKALEEAILLYRGDFLEGFSIPDSILFEEWALITREAFRDQAIRALHKLAEYYQQKEAYEPALQFAKRQIELDPYQEAAHQQVIWVLANSGQRNEALRHYEEYRQLLVTDLGVEPLEQTQGMYEKLVKGVIPSPPAAPITIRRELRMVGECPYIGLAPFREADAPFFFGREAFTDRLTEALRKRSLVAVIVGSSGSGKSSTVFAGLVPRLREQANWLVLHFRPRGLPFQALAGAFFPALEPDLHEVDQLIDIQKLALALREGNLTLHQVAVRALEKYPDASRLLLIVDQFEELYTLCPDSEERRRFLDELLAAVEAGAEQRISPFVLLITLRADFMGQALTHRPFADALQEGSLILGPMNREELRAAIEKPAEMQGAAFEVGLVARILDDVGEEPGNLPLLEFALALLWERLDQGWVTHAAYEEIGRVEGALARYAEEVYIDLEQSARENARHVFIQLVQPGQGTEDTRRVATRDEFGDESWALIQHLADKRLVVTGRDDGVHETAEVVHEALIRGWDRLRGWMDEDRAFRIWQESLRAAVCQWENSARDEGALLRGAPLAQAEVWRVERGAILSQLDNEFIQASMNLQDRERVRRERRRRWTIIGLATGLVIALLLALLAGQQWRRAEDAGALAIARQATALSASTQAIGQRAAAQTAQAQEGAQRLTAQANAEARATAQAFAEGQARTSKARELAAAAIANLGVDPELSILLAMRALDETFSADRTITQEAEEALHRSVQASRLQQTMRSEDDEIWMVYFSPDGTRIIAWSVTQYPGNTRVYDANTGEEFLTFPDVIPLGVHPVENEWIGVKSDIEKGNEIYAIRDFTSGKPSSIMSIPLPPEEITMEAYNWNSELLVRPMQNGETEVWELGTGQETLHLGWEGRPYDFRVSFSPSGERLAAGHMDGTAKVVDLQNGAELLTLPGHTGRVTDIAFSPAGNYIATASGDGTAKVWDVDSGQELVTLSGHTNEIMSLAFSRDERLLATGSWDRTVKVWDLMASIATGNGQELLSLAGHTSLVMDINFSYDGTRLASASFDGTVRVWDIRPEGRGEGWVFVKGQPPGPEWSPAIALSPDGARLATTNADITPQVWDTYSGEPLLSLSGHQDRVQRIEFSPDGAYIVTTGHDNTIIGWDATSGAELFSLSGFDCSVIGVSCDIAFSPDGNSLAIVDNNGMLKLFEVPTLIASGVETVAPEHLAIAAHDDWIWDVAFSPDGSIVITTGRDKTAKIWDAETGMHLTTLSGHQGWVYGVTCSYDGKRIITTSSDGTARVWDALAGELLFTLVGHTASVMQAAFSLDGTLIVTASMDGTVKLWDAETGSEKLTLFGHPSGVTDVAFSPDGKRLYTSNKDGSDRVYLLIVEELMALAQERLTRTFTLEECQKYLHLDECPPL